MECFSRNFRWAGTVALNLALLGCGGGGDSVSSYAKALEYESQEREVARRLGAAEQAELKAKAERDRAAQQSIIDEIERLVILPPDMPKNLEDTCERLVTAYDAYMKSVPNEREAIDWYQGRLKKVGTRRANCVKQGSVPAGSCQAYALERASETIKQLGQEGAQRLMLECAKRHGGSEALSRVTDDEPTEKSGS